MSTEVISLLHGHAPPAVPMPHHPLLASAMLLIAVVTVLMLLGIVRSLVLLRRWRTRPHTCPRGLLAVSLRVGLPLTTNLAWGLGLLLIFPQLAYPLVPTVLAVPDLGYLVLVSSSMALTWGLLRTILMYLVLRRRNIPGPVPAPVPANDQESVGV